MRITATGNLRAICGRASVAALVLCAALPATAAEGDEIVLAAVPASAYPKQATPWGYGVFEEMHWNQMTKRPAANFANPYLGGAVFHLPWAMLEPKSGQLDTQLLDRLLELWESRGKKIILHIKTSPSGYNETNPFRESSTPAWVYQAGAPSIAFKIGEQSQRLPVPWDPVFLNAYGRFLQALAARYDGHPAIEFIIIGPGVYGSTRIIYPEVKEKLAEIGYSDQRWFKTIGDIQQLYREAFHRTPLSLDLAPYVTYPGNKEDPRFSHLAAGRRASEQGLGVTYHNLRGNEHWLKSVYPRFFAALPPQTKLALGVDNPISANDKMRNKYGDPRTIVQYALGGVDALPKLRPSYLIFYEQDVAAATPGNGKYDKSFEDALRRALRELELLARAR